MTDNQKKLEEMLLKQIEIEMEMDAIHETNNISQIASVLIELWKVTSVHQMFHPFEPDLQDCQ